MQGCRDGGMEGEATVHLPPWDAGGRASHRPTSSILQRGTPVSFHGVSPCSWAAPSLVPLSQSNPLPPVGTHRSPLIPRDSPRGDPSWGFAPAPIGAHPKDGHSEGRLCRARREGRRTLNTSSAARAIAQGQRLPGGEKANCKAAAEKKIYCSLLIWPFTEQTNSRHINISQPGKRRGNILIFSIR